MNSKISLVITNPSGDHPEIHFRRHFRVDGKIISPDALPDDTVLNIKLFDGEKRLIRNVCSFRKNDIRADIYNSGLTCYREELDPGRKKMQEFGFPEIMVDDPAHPELSIRKASIKCFYSDSVFKSVTASGSDTEHGMIFDDGIGFLDDNSEPFEVLPEGEYNICVTLCSKDGAELARDEKQIKICSNKKQIICRFNPDSHHDNMIRWSEESGIPIINDLVPGYLSPYLGKWYYHMGLLKMYRANDISMYVSSEVHMFVYLIDPTSTSYETELAFLETLERVEDPKYFSAYCYDIGEADGGKNSFFGRKGKIVRFEEDEYMKLCRVDTVSDEADENIFFIDFRNVLKTAFFDEKIVLRAGSRAAFTGVVRPMQFDKSGYVLKSDNTYSIKNEVSFLRYTFRYDDKVISEERYLLMERIDDDSIGSSVYEFYNIFDIPEDMKECKVNVRIDVYDRNGIKTKAGIDFDIFIKQ